MASQLDFLTEPPPELTVWGEDLSGYRPDVADVRRRLVALLAAARRLGAAPADRREWRVNAVIFPQMANWLPADEAAQLCREFAAEIDRLGLGG